MTKQQQQVQLTSQALTILEKRYFLRDAHHEAIEDATGLFHRVATAVAQAEELNRRNEVADDFFDLMASLLFLPNSPTLMNAGSGAGCLSACFVIPVGDSMEEIMKASHDVAIVQKFGGGTGMALSRVRERGAHISSTHQYACGPIQVLKTLSAVSSMVTQGGKRDGANMAILRCDHPDILEFIHCKDDGSSIHNFNISLGVTDAFMRAFYGDNDEVPGDPYSYYIRSPYTGNMEGTQDARVIFDAIANSAWATGDPGLWFIDRVNAGKGNPITGWEVESCNPCWSGETKVWTIEGPKSFIEMVGQSIPVLTALEDGSMVYRMMRNIRQTRKQAPLIEIELESSAHNFKGKKSVLRLTPDHNLFLKDGTKIQAKDLKLGDRLSSAYSDGSYVDMDTVAHWQVRELAANHQVVSVKELQAAPVYNGTVDETHRYYVVTDEDGIYQGAILSANCGEQELYPMDACNLGSINLGKFVTSNRGIDFANLRSVTKRSIHFLDNVVEVNTYPLDEIDHMVRNIRRVGLGVMGWADLLIRLRIPYDSEEALKIGEQVMRTIQTSADDASIELGRQRGNFPLFSQSIYANTQEAMRNSTRTTIAPTGTISLIAGASSGIEPVFAFEYEHHGLEGSLEGQLFRHPLYQQALDEGWYSPEVFKSAHQIAPEWHVRHQAVFQQYTDNAVSKTINFPSSATVEDVREAYLRAWNSNCKGITIYRDGSKYGQVLTSTEAHDDVPEPSSPETRPAILASQTIKQVTPFGNMYVTVSEIAPNTPFEIFATIGKAGSDVQAMTEALGRVCSLYLHDPITMGHLEALKKIIEQFEGIGGYATSGFGIDRVRSIPDAIAKALKRYLGQALEVSATPHTNSVAVLSDMPAVNYVRAIGALCPECGQATIQMAGGCQVCTLCGYSEC